MAKNRTSDKETPIDGYYVIKPFKDKRQYGNKEYSIGEDVSHLDTKRLKRAIDIGLVEFRENTIE